MMKNKDFAVFILTHNRAEKVTTFQTLKKKNYTGKTYFIVDDTDPQIEKYKELYGDKVIIFNKEEAEKDFDIMDNLDDYRAVVYARNESFKIAKKLGIKHFLQLDDDYGAFDFRYDQDLNFKYKAIENLYNTFDSFLNYLKSANITSIALAQGGDYIGGENNGIMESVTIRRKCMNTFFCSTDKPFKFVGRINEDVNTYVSLGSKGHIFLTNPIVCINQEATQNNSGGLTDIYLNLGTYVKSFYSVMVAPSSVKVALIGEGNRRLHHRVEWGNTIPMIIREKYKKNNT